MSSVLRLEPVETQVSVIDQIRELEAQAEASEEEAVACKYEAARLISEELDRREGGARQLAQEIGKSHTHVLRMERVHKRHGDKRHVQTLAGWNKLYKGDKGDNPQALNWPKPPPSIAIRTPAGYLAEAKQAVKSAIRENEPLKVASVLVEVVGEDVIRRVLRDKARRRKAARRKEAQ